MSSSRLRGLLCAIGGCLAWGFSGTCAQYLLSTCDMPSLVLTTIRTLTAGPILLAVCALRGNPADIRGMFATPKDALQIVFFGFMGIFMSQFVYLEAIAHTNAGTATMLGCLSTVMLLIVVCLRDRRAPKRFEPIGILLAITATWLIAIGDDPTKLSISPIGLLLGLGCAATITIYTLQSKPLMAKWGSMQVVAMGMIIGGLCCSLIALPQWHFPALDTGGWSALVVMVMVGTCLSYSLFFQAILDLPPVDVGMLSVVEPVSATFFSVVWLGTAFMATDYLGFALMCTMVILIALAGEEKPNGS